MMTALLGLALVASSIAVAPDDTLRKRYDLLLKEYEAMDLGWTKQFEDAGAGAPVERWIARYEQWPAWKYLPRFHLIVEEDPNDAAAGDALFWILDIGRAVGVYDAEYPPILERCLELLAKSPHLEDPRMGQAFRYTLDRPSPVTEPFLRLAVEKCRGREVRAQALLALGTLLKDKAELTREPWFEKPNLTPWETFIAKRMDPRVRKYLKEADPQASAAEAESVLKKVIKDYGDVVFWKHTAPGGQDVTVADRAQRALDEFHTVVTAAVGKPAPEIEGSDLDRKAMTLSDDRGKVVVLVFWKSTGAASMELVPRLKRLADRHAGKPFRLLGVNNDADRSIARAAADRAGITWPSWWDRDPKGPIITEWGASSIPRVYVVDPSGVIRHKGTGEKDVLEATVETLLEEASKAQTPKK